MNDPIQDGRVSETSFAHSIFAKLSIGLVVVAAAFLPRLFDLDVFYARDELSIWNWADAFVLAVWQGDIAGTLTGSDYPGIPLFWAHTLFLTIKYSFPALFQATMIPVEMISHSRDIELLAERRLVGGIFVGLQIIVAVWLTRRLFGWRVALLSAIFMGLDPFSLTEARVLRLQMISSFFVTLSALAYLLYLGQRRRSWILGSGILGGLAASSQTSSGFLVPYIWLLLLLDFLFETNRSWSEKFKQMMVNGLIWGGGAVGIFWLIWPSMWIAPLKSLEVVLDVGMGVVAHESIWHGTVFFWGQKFQDDPGLLFYPVVYAFRATPLTWVGLAAALLLAGAWLRRRLKPGSISAFHDLLPVAPAATVWGLPWPLVGILLLLFHIIVITLELSMILSKVDRYLLTIFPALNILSAIGVAALIHWLIERRPDLLAPVQGWLFPGATLILLGLQLSWTLPAHPYFYTYWNPLLGGSRTALQTLPAGSGEGIDQIVAYVNNLPNAAETKLICGASQPWCQYLFKGETLRFADYVGGRWLQADYASFYISQLQRDSYPPEVVDFFMSQKPAYTATIHGATYAWLFKTPQVEHFAGAFNELAGLGQLYGYNLSPAAPVGATGQVGETVTATIWWADFGAGSHNLTLRWIDQSGYEWGRARVIPLPEYASLEANKPAIIVGTADLTIPLGAPPGVYFWRIGVLDPGQGRLLGEFELPDQADQLVVTPGQILTQPDQLTISQRVERPLAPEITLLGYDPPAQVLTADAPAWLSLYWQATGLAPDYQVRLRLLDEAGDAAYHWQGRPGYGHYPTSAWQDGEIARDVWALQVEPETPVGLYDLEISLVNPDHPSDQQPKVTIPDLEVWSQPLTYDIPDMQSELYANFGQHLTLLGYDLYLDATGSESVTLSPVLYWQSQADLQKSFELLLTLSAAETDQALQTWRLPLGVDGAKRFWKANEVINTIYELKIQVAFSRSYHLDIALQDAATGQIIPVKAGDEATETNRLRIERIQDEVIVRVGQ